MAAGGMECIRRWGEKIADKKILCRLTLEGARLLFHPLWINVEVTTRCNLHCHFCTRQYISNRNNGQDISFELLHIIIRKFKKAKIRPVDWNLVGIGEPFLVQSFIEMAHLFRDTFPTANLRTFTNGTLLSPEIEREIIGLFNHITISVNAVSPQDYKALMGVDRYQMVLDNVKRFLGRRGARFPKVEIQIFKNPRDSASADEIAKAINMWQKEIDGKFGDKVLINEIDWRNHNPLDLINIRYPCRFLWYNLAISVKGDVYPCCEGLYRRNMPIANKICLGNINTISISDILSNGKLSSTKKMHLRHEYQSSSLCYNCIGFGCSKNIWFKGKYLPFPRQWI